MPGALGLSRKMALALSLRTAALFVILCQFRLLAADLADTPVFAAALVCAFAAALILAGKKRKPLPAIITLGLIPWAARLLVAFPRIFVQGVSPVLDGLLLNLDRNNFVSLLPFYWAAFSTYFSIRSRNFLRGDIVAGIALLLGTFSIAGTADTDLYRWPIVMVGLFAAVGFMQIAALMFSLPPEIGLRKKESITTTVILFLLIFGGGALFIGPSQERALEQGGGLLEPKIFSFDFSQIMRLESEISMNDDLVLIVKKDYADTYFLIRRYVLSGYNRKQGFSRLENIDERAHPQRLPDRPTDFPEAESYLLPDKGMQSSRIIDQEYYLVNFDSSAFIGMNEPLSVTPFESWDASSFSSVYAVQSRASEALPFELMAAAEWPPSAANLRLSPEEYQLYTEYGDDQRLKAYAEEISGGDDQYWDKVQSIYEWLKYGEYRYSLKPGIAPDGDQLSHFLFNTKKGYCSYYAFAFALLLRSIGIPARVSAGFLVDPETTTDTFDYYPVRSDMAHAWVEVFYPGYGWIEYDPTTENLAEGEEFRFSSGVPPELFERLMKEILDNHSRLNPKEGMEETAAASRLRLLANSIQRFLRRNWSPILLLVSGVIWLVIRCGHLFVFCLSGKPRKKAMRLWAHIKRRLALAGYQRNSIESEAEWVQKIDELFTGIYTLYQGMSAARFAKEYSQDDLKLLREGYRSFTAIYRQRVSAGRRFLAWIIPPLAMALKPVSRNNANSNGLHGGAGLIIIIALLLSFAGDGVKAQDAGQTINEADAEVLFNRAQDAEDAEFWERAIELYNEGIEQYPGDISFPWALGNLYYFRGLYGLAWDEYRKAERIDPQDPEILYRLSRTAGYLNRDTVSVDYLERLLEIDPDNKEAIGNLGWMYYKVHRQSDGERLLSDAMERFGNESDFAMTLGTINANLFRYDEGKKWYLAAIADGEAHNEWEFAAVAHYNLSILESRFYHFALAFERTNASLNAQNRAPGRLARGEMFLRQLDFKRTLADYEEAYEIDKKTPLSKLNLAQVYQVSGRLEEARLYAEDCLHTGDLSWMLNYGIDPVRYRRDIHEILYKTYGGLKNAEGFIPWYSPGEKIQSLFRQFSFGFKAAVHKKLFQKYSLLSADAYGEMHLDALVQYYQAFEPYPRRALSYLREAREFETALIPEAESFYDFEEGRLMKNRALTETALENFDPVWERDMIGEAYAELAHRSKGAARQDAAYQDAVEKLFALNRGALRQEGLSLPVHLGFVFNTGTDAEGAKVTEDRLSRMLKKAGIDAIQKTENRFTLTLTVQGREQTGWNILCELYDGGRGITMLQRSIPLASASWKDISVFVRALGDAVFIDN